MPPRRFLALEANHGQLLAHRPQLAVLPWGATEAHGHHLPYGTDVIEATELARAAAEKAQAHQARVLVLPTVPFGSNEQQLDQLATISISSLTAGALLRDVVRSLKRQGIERLVILNAHGGNEFKPYVRDLQGEFACRIVVVNFYQLLPDLAAKLFERPGDHADEMETSLLLHLPPELVVMPQAGDGARRPCALPCLARPGVWTPRPWSEAHPDTGSGDPRRATADKGADYFRQLTDAIADILRACAMHQGPWVAEPDRSLGPELHDDPQTT